MISRAARQRTVVLAADPENIGQFFRGLGAAGEKTNQKGKNSGEGDFFFSDYPLILHGILFSKLKKISFFLYYLYLSLKAVNQTEAFKLRIEGDELYLYDMIHASATIDRENHTVGFSLIHYHGDLQKFLNTLHRHLPSQKTFTQGFHSQDHLRTMPPFPWAAHHPRFGACPSFGSRRAPCGPVLQTAADALR